MIVGIAQDRRPILMQKGSQILQVMVAEAKVGPMNDTTYDVELMYEKWDALQRIRPRIPECMADNVPLHVFSR